MKKYWILIVLFFSGLIVSAIKPHDYFTWFLEIFPAIIGFVILCISFKRFPFSYFTYCFILVHCYILFIGGHYTYAEVPLFDWIKETFHQNRNNYDKVGHFAQGFIPALIIREIFIKQEIIKNKQWMNVLIVCMCIAISACYEFLEWFVAVVSGQSAEAFLGTQGYVWDTQSDMLYATTGAITMLIVLSKIQNSYIQKNHRK